MLARRPIAAATLAGWSVLVWTTRIRNIWSDDESSNASQWARTALALSFTVLALAVGHALLRRTSWRQAVVVALAAWTALVWSVRTVGIVRADHETAFVVVHTALAVISIALAAWAWREASVGGAARSTTPLTAGHRRR